MKRAAWLLAGAGFLIAPALAADLTGTWEIQGPIDPVCIFIQQGNALAGNCRGPAAQGPVAGSVDGETVRWTFTRTGRGGGTLPPVEFSGTASGESLTGTLSMGGGRGGPFTARRIQAAPSGPVASNTPGAKPPPPPTSPLVASLDSAPPRTVFGLEPDRSAVHQQSHLVCPAEVSGFPRIGTTLFDRWGFDVGCSYRNAAGSLITLYLYRAAGRGTLDEDFNGARDSVPQAMRGAVPGGDTGINPPGAGWRSAGFVLPNGMLSEIFVAPLADWRLKYRATYTRQDIQAVGAAVTALSGIVTKTARPHLERCAAAPAPQRAGQRNRDLNALQALAAAVTLNASETVAEPRPGAAWCAETGFGVGEAAFLFWRNAAAGADGPVDRITAVGAGSPILVVRAAPAAVEAAVAKFQVKSTIDSREIYGVVWDGADAVQLVGIFAGRPSLQEVATLAMGTNVSVYARIEKNGGRITLYKPVE
jgi:hypothetical protein